MRRFTRSTRLASMYVGLAALCSSFLITGAAQAQNQLLNSIQIQAPNGLVLPPFGSFGGVNIPPGTVSLALLVNINQAILAAQQSSFVGIPGLRALSTVSGPSPVVSFNDLIPFPAGTARHAIHVVPFTPENFLTLLRIENLQPEARERALERMASVPGAGQGSGGLTHATNLSSQLGQRLASLRTSSDTSLAALQLTGTQLASSTTDPASIVTAYKRAVSAADGFPLVTGFALPEEIGVFISGGASFGDTDTQGGTEDFTTGSVTAGMDYRVAPTIVVGVAGTYSRTQTDVSFGGDSEGFTAGGSLYGTWYQSNWYTDAYASFATTSTDTRRVTPIGTAALEATADTHGTVLTGGARVGRNYEAGNIVIGPFAAIDYVRNKTNAYTETGAGAFSLIVPETTATSFQTTLGAQAAMTFNIGDSDIAPYAKAAWVHEFHDDAPVTTVAFTGAPTAAFQSVGRSAEANWAQIGGGVSARLDNHLLLNLGANADVGRGDVRRTQISLSLRAAF